MVTYPELFQFCLVVIGIIGVIICYKKEVSRPFPNASAYF